MENLCMNCFKESEGSQTECPFCGHPLNDAQDFPFLPQKTTLAQRYIVGKSAKRTGESLKYIGYDKIKKTKVYIKEFYPTNLCLRGDNFIKVEPRSDYKRFFNKFLMDFLKYFRAVARLRNLPMITSVYDIFEENGTAYVISEWIEGETLDKYLSKFGGSLHWDNAKILFMPLLSSISIMEKAGVKHLGISPENMIVTPEHKLRLVGFATENLRSNKSILGKELHDGCSAIEQYKDHFDPNEATDVYGFTASLFLALTGEYPEPAPKREKNDKLLMPQDILSSLPENVVTALANALRVYPNNRTLSFETLRIELANSPVLQVKNIESVEEFEYSPENKNKRNSGTVWAVISCASALIILIAALTVYWFWLRNNSNNINNGIKTNTSEQISTTDDIPALESTDTEASTNNTSNNKVKVPNLVGKVFKNIQNDNSITDYKIALLNEEFNDNIKEGCITSQTPEYGQEMEPGSTIAVNVSKGSKKRTLPNITGKTLSEASQLITAAKLIPVQSSDFSKEYPEGIVIGYKTHKAGDSVDYGTEVTIIVSQGAV